MSVNSARPKRVLADVISLPPMNPKSRVSLQEQLYSTLRSSIVSGSLAPGTRLPSTRALAEQINLSRNTVINTYLQLWSEGYLVGQKGSGTFVADELPDALMKAARSSTQAAPKSSRKIGRLSARGRNIAALPLLIEPTPHGVTPSMAFMLGIPALDMFPYELWGRLLAARWKNATREMLRPAGPTGLPQLREAIANYLTTMRGVRCTPDHVVVVSGSQQALTLAAQLVLDPGDAAWVEDPGYPAARGALIAAGARLIPVPIDAEGLDVGAGVALEPKARLASVTPAYQFPLGVTMSAARRRALLEWAHAKDAWIVEDDYDSEYRYEGRPPSALQGMDGGERVIYSGSFSKVLLPSLRLGYLVVPRDLTGAFARAKLFNDISCPTVDQLVLTDFLNEGHFARHIRRMRKVCGARQNCLVKLAAQELRGVLTVPATHAGMHILGHLSARHPDDRVVALAAQNAGVHAIPLSSCRLSSTGAGGLVLGFAGATERELRAGVQHLKRILK